MIRSRSFHSDDDSTGSGLSGSSSLRSRTSSITDLLEPAWRNIPHRSRAGGVSLNSSQRGRSLFHQKWANAHSDFTTSNGSAFTSSFRIRYYKYTRRRLNFMLAFCVFFCSNIFKSKSFRPFDYVR